MRNPRTYLLALALILAGFTLRAQHRFAEDSLYTVYQASHDRKEKVKALIELSALTARHDIALSLEYSLMALEAARDCADHNVLAHATSNLGVAYFWAGDYNRATETLLQARQISDSNHDPQQLVRILTNLGAVRFRLDDMEGALAHYAEALEVNTRLLAGGDSSFMDKMQVLYNNIGNIYMRTGEDARAMEYLEKALETAGKHHDPVNEANAANNLGKLYVDRGLFREASHYLYLGLEIREANKDRSGMARSYLNLARYQLKRGQADSARTYLEETEQLARELGARDILQEVYREKAGMLEAAGKYQAANAAWKGYYETRD